MENKKVKWLIYTVLIGLIPIFTRVLIWSVTNGEVALISSSDVIIFGLILHISNINELEHYEKDKSWKTIHNGISITFILFYGLLFTLTLLSEVKPKFINYTTVTYMSMVLSIISFVISYSIYDKINKRVEGLK
jgi:hypothetical protein